MEGATGLTGVKDIFPNNPEYNRFRKLLTRDVNAAIEGILRGGATKIVVNAAHDVNDAILLIENLNAKAELITGSIKPLAMLEGLDQTFDAVFLIGYHAKAGTSQAVLNHTMFFEVVDIRVNEKSMGELGLSALVAGSFKVPIVLVSGDDKTLKEAEELLGNIELVKIKNGIDFGVAQCKMPEKTATLIRNASEMALNRLTQFKPIQIHPPLHFEIEFVWSSMAAAATLITGITRLNPRTIAFKSQNIIEGYQMLTAALLVAKSASPRDVLESLE
jgi:D-amino peptidase